MGKYVVSRPVGGICLNGKEWVTRKGKIMLFKSKEEAMWYLEMVGVDEDKMDAQGIQVEEYEEGLYTGIGGDDGKDVSTDQEV